ncbi:hypothetical protein UFOVP724_56 [uncultured Caudovirales phage]|uniref:Uncharacterized protein n=1 Tax=uncultured Caudovirales phage TaxID=2100421 RepID=A0A6J5NSI7_9CAUD|nr:hypothetical protein UFOVP724_56 [uncultured Caudovirales phage]
MQYQQITKLLDEYSNYQLYNAARNLIARDVRPVAFTLDSLNEETRTKLLNDLSLDNSLENCYVIYDFHTAKVMKELGEPISNCMLYPIWLKRKKNMDILDDLIFQKVQAHVLHKIPIESLKDDN